LECPFRDVTSHLKFMPEDFMARGDMMRLRNGSTARWDISAVRISPVPHARPRISLSTIGPSGRGNT